ncbi:MAG: ATP-binding cassette domain-containing protein [Candidatus Micrarchaeota archaeon]|nr:ATP-binding cassette domain-containing protein [Candidatus Micrarchaeota archaeon]MDE1848170.1 ATP-binding cassette domain-containing protein [Candidatus Micrarchaeota archaeon]MDE1864642.1 ATP-binding cassette domain-containing protein [Candidatus Micrarchaeota archaeon]
MGTSDEIVSAKNLTVGYGGKPVWRDANFGIKRGEFVAVIGPNGAGKTTMFRLLLGLQQPLGGTINVFGEKPRRGNQKIGYIPQRHTIDNETNIECAELVRLAASANKLGFGFSSREEKMAVLDALQAVGAAELGGKSLGSLSGGELQRVFLAEALVSNPEILLLDEPLSNLDLKRIKDLVELIHGVVKSRNATAFLVAHEINPLIQFLDKVIYVANGKVATGTPKEVLTSQRLSALYGTSVEVLRDSRGNIVVVGGEDRHGD